MSADLGVQRTNRRPAFFQLGPDRAIRRGGVFIEVGNLLWTSEFCRRERSRFRFPGYFTGPRYLSRKAVVSLILSTRGGRPDS